MMRREASLLLLGLSIYKAIRFISHSLNGNQPVAIDESSQDDVILTQTYDVFLSFRGEDTRDTFSSYLYEALSNASIQTFMDHKLHKGDDISSVLLKIIERSDISLIIFSKDYASSTWCMDELVHIMKCKDQYGRIVIPIFYDVDPSNVRKQNGSFGVGFAKLKQRFKHDQRTVLEWTNALIRSTNLSGWHSKNFRPEPKLTKMIVKDILSKLSNKSFHLEGLVGIDHQILKIEELLSEARIVGIWGMGGLGKTTLAEAVFDRLKDQFEAFSFVGNVRERLAKFGLDELLRKCLEELLKDEDMNAYNLRTTFVERRLRRKKILLVLDDVENPIAIKDLMRACDWFGEGSRIIITSRDMQVLKNTFASTTYHVQELELPHALHLFSLNAFKQNEPFKSYLKLSERAVYYCKGNPLALIVLGCFLDGRGKEEWESALEKLNQALHQDIFNVLKLSFDGLDDMQKNVFLDIAFLLKEGQGISLDCARCLYGSSTHIDISVLIDRSLISVKFGHIVMHALLLDMGREISKQQLISNPNKPIRVWRPEDIYHLFNDDKEIEATRCVSFDESKMKRITLNSCHLQKMHNLIFFKVYKSDRRKPRALNIRGDLDYLPEKLRFFIWEEYPLSYVPLHLCAENLVMLRMPNSNIRQFGNENQHFPNLKEIILRDSKHLIALPDLSCAPKIETVDVNGCVNLDQINSSIFLENIGYLWVEHEGPKRINIGGSREGTRSGVLFVLNFLDLKQLTFHKVRMKVLEFHNECGFRFQHMVMPLEEIAELRKGTQSLASLLPFVRKVDCSNSPIDFRHDFNQHFTYDYQCRNNFFKLYGKVVRPLRRQMINDCPHFFDDGGEREEEGRYNKSTSLMEDDEEDDELIIMKYCGSNSNATFTRLPGSITRWSLLTQLRLKESDIIRNALSHDHHSTRFQPLLDYKVSIPDILSSSSGDTGIVYNLGGSGWNEIGASSYYSLKYHIYVPTDKSDFNGESAISLVLLGH